MLNVCFVASASFDARCWGLRWIPRGKHSICLEQTARGSQTDRHVAASQLGKGDCKRHSGKLGCQPHHVGAALRGIGGTGSGRIHNVAVLGRRMEASRLQPRATQLDTCIWTLALPLIWQWTLESAAVGPNRAFLHLLTCRASSPSVQIYPHLTCSPNVMASWGECKTDHFTCKCPRSCHQQ
jgi:hypothetical protein